MSVSVPELTGDQSHAVLYLFSSCNDMRYLFRKQEIMAWNVHKFTAHLIVMNREMVHSSNSFTPYLARFVGSVVPLLCISSYTMRSDRSDADPIKKISDEYSFQGTFEAQRGFDTGYSKCRMNKNTIYLQLYTRADDTDPKTYSEPTTEVPSSLEFDPAPSPSPHYILPYPPSSHSHTGACGTPSTDSYPDAVQNYPQSPTSVRHDSSLTTHYMF